MPKKEKIMLDVGSSTIKVYKVSGKNLEYIQSKSLFLKDGFTKESGLSNENKQLLLEFLKQVKVENPSLSVEIYATSIFRKMNPRVQQQLIDTVLESTGLHFNIIPHEKESFYMQQALIGKYNRDTALIINIGGGSTELILVKDKEALEVHELETVGVGSLIMKYPEINESLSRIKLNDLVKEVKEVLPDLKNEVKIAFYSGGELAYMKLAGYDLLDNTLFDDKLHPKMISFVDFTKRNKGIFEKVSFDHLEKLMPENPKWMPSENLKTVSRFAPSVELHSPKLTTDLKEISG